MSLLFFYFPNTKNSVFQPNHFSGMEKHRFFVKFLQRRGYSLAVFLDCYFTYFRPVVRYNEFADEEKRLCRVMNGKIKERLRAPESIGGRI